MTVLYFHKIDIRLHLWYTVNRFHSRKELIMKRIPISKNLSDIPEALRPFIKDAKLFNSSCSNAAKVIYIDKDSGYYLKSAKPGTLEREAEMTRFFHSRGLAAEVIDYITTDRDWMLTAAVPGEDCTYPLYLDDPWRLTDILGETLRHLHSLDTVGCPIPNRTAEYLQTAERNYQSGKFDASLFHGDFTFKNADEAHSVMEHGKDALKSDTLLHGDYCLPNIILDNWRFSAFIDLDNAGVGDRHIDLFWGAWTLIFNLKTDKYCSRFLDAYGRDTVDTEILKLIAAIETFG